MRKNSLLFDMLYGIYLVRGNSAYMIGEKLTQREHAIQAYRWMRQYNGSCHMRVAAFFHDIGHLVVPRIDPTKENIDDKHEKYGSEYLESFGFKKSVTEPIRLHVTAKRYLVATQPKTYFDKLSEASKITFKLQGGQLNEYEIKQFRCNIYSENAVTLRICDDKSKNVISTDLTSEEISELSEDIQNSLT
jgi:predicted HD phosphohydrolase